MKASWKVCPKKRHVSRYAYAPAQTQLRDVFPVVYADAAISWVDRIDRGPCPQGETVLFAEARFPSDLEARHDLVLG